MATKITIWIVEMTNSFLQCSISKFNYSHKNNDKTNVCKSYKQIKSKGFKKFCSH